MQSTLLLEAAGLPAEKKNNMGNKRTAKCYVLVNPEDCIPPHGLELEFQTRDSKKMEWLEQRVDFNRDVY